MIRWYERTAMLLGSENIEKLSGSHIMIFGIGGVGSYTAEALARCNIGNITLIDNDIITQTNINRQIHATHQTIGKSKVGTMRERILLINPDANVTAIDQFVTNDNISEFLTGNISFVVDAIDTVTSKIAIIEYSKRLNIPIISSMGTGNKIYPELFEITDIYKTKMCPLAKVMRKELKKRDINDLTVCYSAESPIVPESGKEQTSKRQTPASISFVPPVAGFIIAGHVIRELLSL